MEIQQSDTYRKWFAGLRDRRAAAKIQERIDRLVEGNSGDVRHAGKGVSELRVNYGPGYRVYYIMRDATIVLLLAGGDKKTQDRDIRRALALAKKAKE